VVYKDDDAGRVWVIDTSSIIAVRRLQPANDAPKVFAKLTELVRAERLFFPPQVLDELERESGNLNGIGDGPGDWAREVREEATKHGIPFAEVTSVVMTQVSEILDDDKGREEADPYVLGLAVRLRGQGHEVTVITEEHRDRDSKMSMGTAAGLLGLASVPLRAFVLRRGYWKPRQK
jgi:hypothetical protein